MIIREEGANEYTNRIMGEKLTQREWIGTLAVMAGTLTIGIEGIYRPTYNMAWLDFNLTVIARIVLLLGCLLTIGMGLKNKSSKGIGLGFGLSAGTFGSMDP
jgi:drug/metabolite transporter (DMT)-like permease